MHSGRTETRSIPVQAFHHLGTATSVVSVSTVSTVSTVAAAGAAQEGDLSITMPQTPSATPSLRHRPLSPQSALQALPLSDAQTHGLRKMGPWQYKEQAAKRSPTTPTKTASGAASQQRLYCWHRTAHGEATQASRPDRMVSMPAGASAGGDRAHSHQTLLVSGEKGLLAGSPACSTAHSPASRSDIIHCDPSLATTYASSHSLTTFSGAGVSTGVSAGSMSEGPGSMVASAAVVTHHMVTECVGGERLLADITDIADDEVVGEAGSVVCGASTSTSLAAESTTVALDMYNPERAAPGEEPRVGIRPSTSTVSIRSVVIAETRVQATQSSEASGSEAAGEVAGRPRIEVICEMGHSMRRLKSGVYECERCKRAQENPSPHAEDCGSADGVPQPPTDAVDEEEEVAGCRRRFGSYEPGRLPLSLTLMSAPEECCSAGASPTSQYSGGGSVIVASGVLPAASSPGPGPDRSGQLASRVEVVGDPCISPDGASIATVGNESDREHTVLSGTCPNTSTCSNSSAPTSSRGLAGRAAAGQQRHVGSQRQKASASGARGSSRLGRNNGGSLAGCRASSGLLGSSASGGKLRDSSATPRRTRGQCFQDLYSDALSRGQQRPGAGAARAAAVRAADLNGQEQQRQQKRRGSLQSPVQESSTLAARSGRGGGPGGVKASSRASSAQGCRRGDTVGQSR